MPIIIKTQKVLKGKEKYRLINEIKMLPAEKLPKEYVDGAPACFCYSDNPNKIIFKRNTSSDSKEKHLVPIFSITCPVLFPEKTFRKLKKLIIKSGDRLMQINKQTEWQGEQVYKI